MKPSHLAITLLMVLACQPLQAATEYLRAVGTVRSDYGPVFDPNSGIQWNRYYVPEAGLVPGQVLWFDFRFDTSADAPGRSDSSYQDFFEAEYLAGAVPPGYATHGVTSTFPEGTTTWLLPAERLLVGSAYSASQFDNRSIDTWVVGQVLYLMGNSYFEPNRIGVLELVYRGSVAPPIPTPLPPALGLLATALAVMAGRKSLWLCRHRAGLYTRIPSPTSPLS